MLLRYRNEWKFEIPPWVKLIPGGYRRQLNRQGRSREKGKIQDLPVPAIAKNVLIAMFNPNLSKTFMLFAILLINCFSVTSTCNNNKPKIMF